MALAIIILAAGKGTRMQSDLPKVLHPIGNAPMLAHVMAAAETLAPDRTIVIAGHGFDAVSNTAKQYNQDCEVLLQAEQLGTGHAVDQARAALNGFDGQILVMFGDSPLFKAETLSKLVATLETSDVAVLGFDAKDPARYGRLIVSETGLDQIIEYKDATEVQRSVTLCNSGVMAASSDVMFDMLAKLENNNASNEYYLTEVVAHARSEGLKADYVLCPEDETLGVNSRFELAQAEALFQTRRRQECLENGVAMAAPDTVYFSFDTNVGRNSQIDQFVVFGPGVSLETGTHIRAFSHLEGAHVSEGCVVGPYARLRPGAELDHGAKVGNFVEVKAAQLGAGAKVNHLSYIGDATVGKNTNIGAGTVTCNYDGYNKHHTTIGEDAFIGSDTMLVAPVSVGDGAMTASGSVITKDVANDDLALGRAPQVNKSGFAKRLKERLAALKSKNKDKQ